MAGESATVTSVQILMQTELTVDATGTARAGSNDTANQALVEREFFQIQSPGFLKHASISNGFVEELSILVP